MNNYSAKRKKIIFRFSIVFGFLGFLWIAVQMNSLLNSASYPDEESRRVYAREYKGKTYYITRVEFVLTIALILIPVLGAPALILITSPRLGFVDYTNEE